MGQLHLGAEDTEKCPIRVHIFIAQWLFLQSKGLLSFATGSRKEVYPLSGSGNKSKRTAVKIDINVKFLPSGYGLPRP